MNPNSKFDSMMEKIELWTVIISILVLSLAYDGYFQTPNLQTGKSLSFKDSSFLDNFSQVCNFKSE